MGKRGRGMTVKEAMDIRNNPTYEDVNNKELSQCIDGPRKANTKKT